MPIGYACVTRGVYGADQHALRLSAVADEDRFLAVARANLSALGRIYDYNLSRGIRLFRVSSGLIPLASHPENPHDWAALLAPELAALKERADAAGMRLSMHPGQYTVLDSHNPETVSAAAAEVEYSARLLSLLSDGDTLVLLHHGNRPDRMEQGFSLLSAAARSRLALENDEVRSSPAETLAACRQLDVPMVYDALHAEILAARRGEIRPDAAPESLAGWHREALAAAAVTWENRKRPQKIHFSLQRDEPGARPGAHSESIPPRVLAARLALWSVDPAAVDVMLEVKDKNLSAVACTQALLGARRAEVEREWAAWKYLVMERSRATYDRIRAHLNAAGRTLDGEAILAFHELVAGAMSQPPGNGGTVNALQHVWGYFKKTADEEERKSMAQAILRFSAGTLSRDAAVARLARMAVKYDDRYLLDSYFFDKV